jgi:hypothetical protein
VSVIHPFFSQATAVGTGSNIKEIDRKGNEEIKKFEDGTKSDIREICEHMKHCKFEQFKVLMTKLHMGVVTKDTVGSAAEKISPFSNIYFYDKNNLNEAKEMQWSDVPILPVPE